MEGDGIRCTETTDYSKYIEAAQYGSPVNCSKYSEMADMTMQ
jgi:hypothetical protein